MKKKVIFTLIATTLGITSYVLAWVLFSWKLALVLFIFEAAHNFHEAKDKIMKP